MLPELGQWAVTTSLLANFTSAMKRLYLLIRVPGMSCGQVRLFDFVELSAMFISKLLILFFNNDEIFIHALQLLFNLNPGYIVLNLLEKI